MKITFGGFALACVLMWIGCVVVMFGRWVALGKPDDSFIDWLYEMGHSGPPIPFEAAAPVVAAFVVGLALLALALS